MWWSQESQTQIRERDKTQVRQLTRIFQTIHGLIDAEDDETLAVAGCADEREERETGKDCRGVRVYVDSNELALGEIEGNGSAEVEIGEVMFKAMLTAVREATLLDGGQEEGRRSPPAVPRTRRFTSSRRERDGSGRRSEEGIHFSLTTRL